MGVARLVNLSTAGFAIVAFAMPAGAQVSDLAIPAGPLKRALDLFARQSGRQVIYRTEDVASASSPGTGGRLSPDAALKALLAGTGLTARNDPSGAFAIVRTASPLSAESGPGREPDIVVTGSRIRRPAVRSVAPTLSFAGEDIFETGKTGVGEALDQLPVLRSTLTQSNSTRIDTGAGLNMLDLRGLGINRTLVLENGRRHVPGATFASAVDVNAIPTELIDRVDIVTGGSSAVYGSDAIAGVVNFILKRDFEGAQLHGQRGLSRYGDAGQVLVTALAGANFADGGGNLTASLEFAHGSDWYASDRANYRRVAAYAVVDTDEPGLPNGSDGVSDTLLVHDRRAFGVSNGGTFLRGLGADGNFVGYLFQPDGSLVAQTGQRVGLPPFAGYDGGNGANFREGKLFSIYPDLRRSNLSLLGRFQISSAFEPFVEATYAHVKSLGSSFGSFFTVGAWGPREVYRTDNPFLTDDTRRIIRSSINLPDGEDSSFFFRRNYAEFGPVVQLNRRDTYRLVAGVRGKLQPEWSYEVSANVGRVTSRTRFTGNVDVQRYLLAIDSVNDPATGRIVCRSQVDPSAAIPYEGANVPAYAQAQLARDVAECVPLNPFGEGNISPAARDYLLSDTGSRSRITQTVLNGFVAGDTGRWFELPGGPVGIVAGAEFRRERFRDVQEALLESGITHATPQPAFEPPRFGVTELFGELRLPLLKRRPLFDELIVSGAGRLARYKGDVGTVFAWNLGTQWAPARNLRFQLGRSRAVRAPNLVELYRPLGTAFNTTVIQDPCAGRNIGAGSPNRLSNCRSDGVPEQFDFVSGVSFEYLAGGNSGLEAEKSDSWTVSATIEPASIPGVSIAAHYYDIKVRKVITSPTVQAILNSCYDAASLDNPFCALFDRNRGPGEGPNGEIVGEILIGSLQVVPLNYAALKVRGVDVDLGYRRQIPALGLLRSRILYTLALQNDSFLDRQDPERKNQNLLELGNPRHALNASFGLQRGLVTLGYRLRYFSKMSIGPIENIRSIQGRPPENADAFPTRYYSGATYHDARLSAAVGGMDWYVGVDNIANRKPPPGIIGVADEGGIFDNVGRFFYAGAVARF
ncbi:MAG: TonB-dependent receptor domain-containing protein [Sphingomicrobium sp.]